MKIFATLILVILALIFVVRALLLGLICVCGACGWMFNPWSLVFAILAVLNLWSIRWVWLRSKPSLRRAKITSLTTLAFMIWGTGGYIVAMVQGNDYFDPLLFIPIALSILSTILIWIINTREKSVRREIA